MENLQPILLRKPTLLESIVECLLELLKSQSNSQTTVYKVYNILIFPLSKERKNILLQTELFYSSVFFLEGPIFVVWFHFYQQ